MIQEEALGSPFEGQTLGQLVVVDDDLLEFVLGRVQVLLALLLLASVIVQNALEKPNRSQ